MADPMQIMKLACCSDTHGALPPSPPLDDIAAWLHAGDVDYGGPDRSKVAKAQNPPELSLSDWVRTRTAPVYAVRGNHDMDDLADFFRHSNDIGGRVVHVAERLWLASIGWAARRYNDLPAESDLRPVCDTLRRQLLRQLPNGDRWILLCRPTSVLAMETFS